MKKVDSACPRVHVRMGSMKPSMYSDGQALNRLNLLVQGGTYECDFNLTLSGVVHVNLAKVIDRASRFIQHQ